MSRRTDEDATSTMRFDEIATISEAHQHLRHFARGQSQPGAPLFTRYAYPQWILPVILLYESEPIVRQSPPLVGSEIE